MDITKVMTLIESILLSGVRIGFYMMVILILFIGLEFLINIIIKNMKVK